MTTALSLYALSGQLQQIAQQLADEGFDEQTISDTLESLSGDFDEKAKAIVQLSRNFESLAEQIKEAEAEMAKRRKRLESRVAALKAYVLREMQATGITRVECPLFAVSVRKNPPTVDVFDPQQIPEEFWHLPPPPERVISKDALKAAIKAGREVPGARMVQGTRLHVE